MTNRYSFTGSDLAWFVYSLLIATIDLSIGVVKGGNGHPGWAWFYIIIAFVCYASAVLYVHTAKLKAQLEARLVEVAKTSVTNNYTSNYVNVSK